MENPTPLISKTGYATLKRPNFSEGLLLEADDLNAGVSYTRDLTRLLFRSLFGCGVICGLTVKAKLICKGSKLLISVDRGLALDCMGNPLEVAEPQSFELDSECKDFKPALWVALCYSEKCCRPRDVSCSQDGDGQSKPTRVRDAYEIRIYASLPKCACQCPVPDGKPPGDKQQDGCCDDAAGADANAPAAAPGRQAAQTEDKCPCYSAHFRGECECECGCTCVLIGKILPNEQPLDAAGKPIPGDDRAVDTVTVRRIRPVLNGYLQCLMAPKGPAPEPPRQTDKPVLG